MDGLSSFLLCLLGHHRHVPGAGRQYVPAGVPGCGQGQGQRRDDDLLPQRRTPAQLAATADARQPGLQRQGGSLAPARGAALRFPTLTPEAASAFAGGRAGGLRPRPGVPASCEHQADQRCHPLLKAPFPTKACFCYFYVIFYKFAVFYDFLRAFPVAQW